MHVACSAFDLNQGKKGFISLHIPIPTRFGKNDRYIIRCVSQNRGQKTITELFPQGLKNCLIRINVRFLNHSLTLSRFVKHFTKQIESIKSIFKSYKKCSRFD